jgi:tripartite-type tricarboxylate transporter receptor subunit TctC
MATGKSIRRWACALVWAICLVDTASAAPAESYPSRPIRIIVPFAAGGVADSSARVIADRLSARLGQSVVVDNRPGAGGNIGTAEAAKMPPDGHTLLLGFDGTMVINPFVYSKLPFDTLRDFAPVTKLGDATLILVAHPSVPANDLRELIADLKQSGGSLAYGTSGVGGTPHLGGELLAPRTGINLTHVPYKGGAQALTDVLGGQIPLVYTAIATAQQHVKAGKLKGLAVSSAKRSASLPEVGTFIENGVEDFVVDSWVGILAPAKTPRPIIDRLHRETAAVLGEPNIQERYRVLGIEPVGNTPEQFRDQIAADLDRWQTVVKKADIRAE